MAGRIGLQSVRRIGGETFARDSEGRVSARHLEMMKAGRGCDYMKVPSPDDWIPVVGYAPDQETYQEVGFIVADPERQRSVILARFLIQRTEGGTVLHADWYPKAYDPVELPDYCDILDINSAQRADKPPTPPAR